MAVKKRNFVIHGGGAIGLRTEAAMQRLAAPRAPSAPGVPPVAQAPVPGAPPRATAQFVPDAQYIAEAAQQQFARTNQVNQLNAESESSRTSLQEAIRRLSEDTAGQRQGIKETANKQGLFYSGQLGKRLGDLEAMIARQRADIQSEHSRGEAAREAARQAILQGQPLEEAALAAAAVERQLGRDTTAAQAGQLAAAPQLFHGKTLAQWAKMKRGGKYIWPNGTLHSTPYRGN